MRHERVYLKPGTFWAAAPKGTKSCRTRRLSFVRPFVSLLVRSSPPPAAGRSDLKSAPSGLKSDLYSPKSALPGLIFVLSGLKPALSSLKSAIKTYNLVFLAPGLKPALLGSGSEGDKVS